jgi:hypothetical protein
MFNPKQFENKVYALVTQQVNKVFSKLLKGSEKEMQAESIKLQRQVMEALHYIAEEVSSQILCGLLINIESKNKRQ